MATPDPAHLPPAPVENEVGGGSAYPADPFNAPRAFVLVASLNVERASSLREELGVGFSVRHVPNLGAFMNALEHAGDASCVVLLDCTAPTLHSESVAALTEDAQRTEVVLWGRHRAEAPTPRGRSWRRIGDETSTQKVGALCRELLA